ncbi:MAG: hypothetical protein CM15mP102_11910 [Flavobacteriales bacterium]|nr:MAG: hypothetical protein CM15mP102_11910 [Flavobacteriales bacterium]
MASVQSIDVPDANGENVLIIYTILSLEME